MVQEAVASVEAHAVQEVQAEADSEAAQEEAVSAVDLTDVPQDIITIITFTAAGFSDLATTTAVADSSAVLPLF